jgi:hypothetical protein
MNHNILPGTIFTLTNSTDLYYFVGMNSTQTTLFYLPINFSYDEKLLHLEQNKFNLLEIKSPAQINQHKNLSFYK